ncbi:MAG: flagellar assembly protein FliW [Lachnospiraceae bacterium]
MHINTKVFGEVEIDEDRIIRFGNGIVGFPELTEFALLHDDTSGKRAGIRWMQSIQEPAFAMPVMDPLDVIGDYNPEVDDELLRPLGTMHPEEMLVLVTITVPADIKKMSVNLRAPFIINGANRHACQVIAEGEQYQVRFPIYDILQAAKKAGE